VSRRGRQTRIPLDGLTESRRATLLEDATDWLVTLADDLGRNDPDGIERIKAVGRSTFGLGRGELSVPDRMVRDLVERQTGETSRLEELEEEYERELAGHEAWLALLTVLAKEEADGDG
jgi:hypothetical protein